MPQPAETAVASAASAPAPKDASAADNEQKVHTTLHFSSARAAVLVSGLIGRSCALRERPYD